MFKRYLYFHYFFSVPCITERFTKSLGYAFLHIKICKFIALFLTITYLLLKTLQHKEVYPFLGGGGEMGELTRNFDWSQTSLGMPDQWPYSLRITVSNLLRSKFPMFLWWGEEMIQFYNDAYRPSLGNSGKHPFALGQKAKDCWLEIWDIVSPYMKQVQTTGEATWMEDQLVPIYRNGRLEDVYWTYSYSSVLDNEGHHAAILVTCVETTKKVLFQKKVEENSQHLRNIILQAPVAMCLFRGKNFVIEIANNSMFEFWGKSADDVINRPLFEAIPEARSQGYEELLAGVLKTRERFSASELPVTLPRAGGVQTVYINFTYEPIREADGAVSGIMAMAADVTEQVMTRRKIEEVVAERTKELAHANEALVDINYALARSNANLEEFAHAASHDLKEPIRKIQTFMSRLKTQLADRLNAEHEFTLSRIESANERMGALIDDLLLYSHVSQRPYEKEEIDLNKKISKVLEDLELAIEQKRGIIKTDSLPIVKGYGRQLQQLFQNLIGNALKYSRPEVVPEVQITSSLIMGRDISLTLPQAEPQKQFHLITVKDNGIGFEQSEAERIFQMFHRLHGRVEYEGTGIGLSIVRKVVENHNGFVYAQGRPGSGASFFVGLPVE